VPVALCPSGFRKRSVAVYGRLDPPIVTCTRTWLFESTQIPACAISNVPDEVVTNARIGDRALMVDTVNTVGVLTRTWVGEIELILSDEAKLKVKRMPVVPNVCVAEGDTLTRREFDGPPETKVAVYVPAARPVNDPGEDVVVPGVGPLTLQVIGPIHDEPSRVAATLIRPEGLD
jgi:hypothetical protein